MIVGRRFIQDEDGIRVDFSPPPAPVAPSMVRDGILHLRGEIKAGGECNVAAVRKALEDLPRGAPIVAEVHSGGGDLREGLAIYLALRLDPRHLTVRVFNQAWSAGALVAMAADRIEVGPLGCFGIHNAAALEITSQGGRITASFLDLVSAGLAEADEQQIDVIAHRLRNRHSRGWIADALRQSRAFVGRDAVAEGFADALIQDTRITEASHGR